MRILSYNIHKGIGGRDRLYRLQRIIDLLAHEQADLVCLQEVVRGWRRARYDDQPRLLGDAFHFAVQLYQMNVRYQEGGYGNLLLSRWPLVSKHHISLRMGVKKPRGAQIAVIRTPEGPLRLVNWHLGLAEKERWWQVDRLLGHALFREGGELPTLLAGDTNDWRNNLAAGSLAEHDFRHVTHPISRFRTFPATVPMGSLDKFYYRGQLRVKRVHVVRSKLARVASDHLPVVLDFRLGRSSA
ncbi:MAG: endonuclease [Planctomycetota bacterium]|nr:MAG: endonuclease [Planctomycetota bacterium]REJ96105.1 MAG: endonuclease [Planctomycetota bacterium]REK21877.1 MAG: endonuclease [Planctomycetota bacterium]REK46685.1 MAG: endonuclease [Planctomycetota bacterium]